jgi:Cu(I)-responsive transcriptional regulator
VRDYAIGQLAKAGGCKVQTVRYYEEIGLLPPPPRSAGGQRVYGQSHMDRLVFVRHARQLGFPLDAIRELLAVTDDPGQPCAAIDAIAKAHLAEVDSRITRLKALRGELARMIDQCRGGKVENCRIIEALADHQEP